MISCIVVDDERPAREEIEYLLNKNSFFEVSGSADNGVKALELIVKIRPDVIFCDINMPVMDGIELAKKMLEMKINSYIVFVTAYDEFAIKAFELNAVDYLLKPISEDRFLKTLCKLKDMEKVESSYLDNMNRFLNEMNPGSDKQSYLSLYKDGLLYPIKLDEIISIFVEDKMTFFNTLKGEFTSSRNLCEVEKKLNSEMFLKCHRSYIININYIESIVPWFNSTYRVKMKGIEEEIPISRSQTSKFKEIMHIM